VNITDVSIDINASDVTIFLNGPQDISKAINFVINKIKLFYIDKISERLEPAVRGIMQNMINKELNKLDYLPQIKNSPLYVNYSLTQAPKVTLDNVEFFFNGSFFIHQQPIITNSVYKLPEFQTASSELQFFISSYTLESALDGMHQGGMLQYQVDPVEKIGSKTYYINTTTLGIFIPNFIDEFGRDKPVTTNITSEDPAPTLTVTVAENQCNMNLKIDQFVNNGTSGNIKALTVHVGVQFAVSISTVEKYVIPTFEVVNITILSYTSSMGNIDTNSLNMLINFLEALMLPILNNKFSQGFELPIIHQVLDLTNTTVQTDNGFIKIESTPTIIIKSQLETKSLSIIQKEEHTLEEQLEKVTSNTNEFAQKFMSEIMKNFRGSFDNLISI